MSSKKNKKSKGTTLSLQEFNLQLDDKKVSAGQNVVYAPKQKNSMASWADEVEDDDSYAYEKERILLPSAPRASRGPAVDESQIPKEPPYVAHLGNLSYDIGEEDVYKFFRNLDIIELRLPRDGNSNRLRGFGYVEFSTKDDLIEALIRHEEMLKGRQVRISLGQNQQNRNDGDRRGDRGGGGGFRSDDTPDDWRSTSRETFNDAGSGGTPANFERRPPRDGPRDDRRYMDRPPRPDRGDREQRGGDRDRDGRRDRDYDRGYRGGSFEEETGPSDWRSSMKPREEMPRERPQYQSPPSFERNQSEERRGPPSGDERPPPREPEPPRERKKLVIAPRTVPNPPGANEPNDAANAAIFGGAKPVDTAAREREIEEKLAQLNTTPSPPPPLRERTRDRRESESDRERGRRESETERERGRDRSHEEPQQYRILKRPSSERTAGDSDNSNVQSSQSPEVESSKPPPQLLRRAQPALLRSSQADSPPVRPPKIITTTIRSDRERMMSTSSVGSRGSIPDSSSQSHCHPQPFNGPRSIINHSSGGPPPHYPVPPAPGASHIHRRKSDSDEGDHDDNRSRHSDRQRDAPRTAPPTNAWTNRRHADQDGYHDSRQERPDRKTPDSDRNGEKEKDSHSEPEDDRDSHRFVKEYIKDGDDNNYRRGPDRDFRGHRNNRDGDRSDRDRDDGYRRGGNWNNNGPRRGDGGGPRRMGGFQDDRRDNRRDDRDRGGMRGDRDRDLDRRDLRDTRRPSGGDRMDRERDFRSGGAPNRMDRGRGGGGGGYDRGNRDMGFNRRGGPPSDKGMRGPPTGRMNSRDDYYRDSDGFENIRGTGGRERPMPKHTEEKPALLAGANKFSALVSGDQSD